MNFNPEVKVKSPIYWDLWWLSLAKHYSTGSKDPSTKVGSVIVHKKRLVAAGYNGFRSGEDDDPNLYWDRDYKIENCVHAEINAMNSLNDELINDATIYVYPLMPCFNCAKKIVNDTRIERIVTTDYEPERWEQSFKEAKQLIANARVNFTQYPITQVF